MAICKQLCFCFLLVLGESLWVLFCFVSFFLSLFFNILKGR